MTVTVTTVAELRGSLELWRRRNESIAFVPTMGNLHDGHLELVKHARATARCVVVSIFVNSLQFDSRDDFARYPRTVHDDTRKLEAAGVDVLFLPTHDEIYPEGDVTRVHVPGMSEILCGAHRPGHFLGVTTVVSKLFNMVQPDVAVFGLKDYQQYTIISRMVNDLRIPVRLMGVDTVREPDGLAMSSRNSRLSDDERRRASGIFQVLSQARERLKQGEDARDVELWAKSSLDGFGLRTEYVNVCRASDLAPATSVDTRRVILLAAWCGNTRLIDNVRVDD